MTGSPGYYQVTFRFRGLVEIDTYLDGISEGGPWLIGGTPYAENVNYYRLTISDPPQTYYLNHGTVVSDTQVIDYQKTMTIAFGASVVLYATSIDNQESANASDLVVPNDQPGYPVVVAQPYDGQFAQADAIVIIPLPAPHCTFDPAAHAIEWTLSNANQTATLTGAPSGFRSAYGAIAVSTGKHQIQFKVGTVGTTGGIGIAQVGTTTGDAFAVLPGGFAATASGFLVEQGTVISGSASYVSGDYVVMWFDADAGNLWIQVNQAIIGGGNPFLGTSPTISGIPAGSYVPGVYGDTTGNAYTVMTPNYLLSGFSQW